jgi:hypothetical protein
MVCTRKERKMTKIEAYDELYKIIKQFSPMNEKEIDNALYSQVTFQDIKDAIVMMNETCAQMKEIVGKVDEDD